MIDRMCGVWTSNDGQAEAASCHGSSGLFLVPETALEIVEEASGKQKLGSARWLVSLTHFATFGKA